MSCVKLANAAHASVALNPETKEIQINQTLCLSCNLVLHSVTAGRFVLPSMFVCYKHDAHDQPTLHQLFYVPKCTATALMCLSVTMVLYSKTMPSFQASIAHVQLCSLCIAVQQIVL